MFTKITDTQNSLIRRICFQSFSQFPPWLCFGIALEILRTMVLKYYFFPWLIKDPFLFSKFGKYRADYNDL